ncbi:hypothetical protein, partial [Nocardia sp. NPDC004722]
IPAAVRAAAATLPASLLDRPAGLLDRPAALLDRTVRKDKVHTPCSDRSVDFSTPPRTYQRNWLVPGVVDRKRREPDKQDY